MPLSVRRSLIDQVRKWRKIAYATCVGLTVLAGAAVFISISAPNTSVAIAVGEPFFDAGRAFRATEDMWTFLSTPAEDSEESEGMFAWFEGQLPGPNMATRDAFEAPMGDATATLENYSVVLKGVTDEVIVIAAPRDTPTVVKVEPLTYTSGTGALLELIDVLYARPHQKTLVFLSTEDSGNGGLGIAHFLDTSPLASQVSVVISFQALGKVTTGTGYAHPLLAGVTSARNTTPGWLLQLVEKTFSKSEVEVVVPGLWRQAADRAMALAQGDQIAGLSKGVPSIRLYDEAPGNPSATGLQAHGPALERLVMSLDGGAELPGDPGTALLLQSGRYLTNGSIVLLAVLCLLPSLSALTIWLFVARPRIAGILRHLRNLASFVVPLILLLLMAYFLTLGGMIPRYDLQVPTEGVATQFQIAPVLILLVIFVPAFIVSRRFLGYFRSHESRPVNEMAKLAVGFSSLILGLILVMARSPFLMLVALSPAWVWPLVTCFSEPVYRGALLRRRPTTNLLVLALGFAMPVFFYAYVASRRSVGWFSTGWFWLVQTTSGAYGLAGPLGVIFIAAGLAILAGVKRMRVVPIESLDVRDELSMLELPAPRSRRRQSRGKAKSSSKSRTGGVQRPPLMPRS